MRRLLGVGLGLCGVLAWASPVQAAVWGSYDASRINYPAGVLADGSVHTTMREELEAGDDLAAPVAELTSEYLEGVDVFYTSLLRDGGVLSPAEQAALFDWLFEGGTLIVSSDTLALEFYTSFTAAYGVDLYVDVGNNGVGVTIADHPITQSVTTLLYVSNSSFAFDPNATELAQSAEGFVFAAVIEPEPDTCTTGRILILGDHHLFTDAYVGEQDNLQLLRNVIQWAGDGPDLTSCCGNGMLDPAEECDDGNDVDDDGCDNDCRVSAVGSSTGPGSTGGNDDTGASTTGAGTSGPVTTSSSSTSGVTAGVTSIESATGFTAGPPEEDEEDGPEDDDGCGCRATPRSTAATWWLLVLLSFRRSRRGRR